MAATILPSVLALTVTSCALATPALGRRIQTVDQGAAKSQSGFIEIDGRVHPELIPVDVAWEWFFRTIVDVAYEGGTQLMPDRVIALSKYNLLISPSEVRIVLRIARATLAKAGELRKPLDEEHASGRDLGWTLEQHQRRISDIRDAVIDGRDEVIRLLPRKAAAAVKRYVATNTIPGIKVGVRQ